MFSPLESILRDLKYALRLFSRSKGFAAIAIAALAFGIGANTALFSVVHAVLLQPLPYERPQDLYSVHEIVQPHSKWFSVNANSGNFLLWSERSDAFSAVAALMPQDDNLTLKGETVQIHGVRASAALFPMLGVHARIGALFTEKDDRSGNGTAVVLTDSLWKRQFHSDSAILGKKILLSGNPAVVIGVLPPAFYFPKQTELFAEPVAGWTHSVDYFSNLNLLPYETEPGIQMFNFAVIARLRPGVSAAEATAQLDAIEYRVAKNASSVARLWVELKPLKTSITRFVGERLWICMSGAALVLLLVCVNLAGLLLARNAARAHEVALRTALGAGRFDLLRQFTLEALLLAAAGGLLGTCAGYWGVRALRFSAPIDIPRLQLATIDGRILLFSIAATFVTCLLFSLLPSWQLASGGYARLSHPVSRTHRMLAISQVALCTILLISALLIARSFLRVWQSNQAMNEPHVLTLDLATSSSRFEDSAVRRRVFTRIVAEAATYPGVEAAGIASTLPLTGDAWNSSVRFLEYGRSSPDHPLANFRFVSPGYTRAIGLPLMEGRHLSDSDSGKHFVLISERLAHQLPANLNPVGMHVQWRSPIGQNDTISEIAGVVKDVRIRADQQPPFLLYIPYWEWPPWSPSLVLRTRGNPSAIASGMRNMIRHIDSEIAVPRVQAMSDILSTAVAPRRFMTLLGLLFAGSATFLAALGLYGLIALSASQRTREIGIRLAVGAQSTQILQILLSESFKLALVGLTAGLACAWMTSRLLTSLLYDVKPADPITYLSVSAGLLLVSLLAACAPARRAMQTDPMAALKAD
jgi:predicted permease